MNQWKPIRQAWMLMVVLLVTLASRPAEAMAPKTLQCGGWQIVPSPNPYTYFNSLNGVAAASADDVWAVGYGYANGSTLHTLIEHWNGSTWQVATSPTLDSSDLHGITALSADDVWSVGFTGGQTLIEHWDGTQWSMVPSPSVGSYVNILSSVSAISPSDIWTVGFDELTSGANRTLIEHWDGTKWSIVASPNVKPYANSLYGVTAISSTDVWAVGVYNSRQVVQQLVEHWDGSQWHLVPTPGNGYSGLAGVTSVNANDVWTVGVLNGQGLTEHWNGHHWRIVKSPDPRQGGPDDFLSVAAGAANDIWTVGNYETNQFQRLTLTEQWDGTSWQIVASPNHPAYDNYLTGVSVAPDHSVWTVGSYHKYGGSTTNTLIEYYC